MYKFTYILFPRKREEKYQELKKNRVPNGVELEASALPSRDKHNHRTAQTHAHNPAPATTPQETEQDHAKIKLLRLRGRSLPRSLVDDQTTTA